MNNIKLSDWKALDAIQDLIREYQKGEKTDYETLIAINKVLSKHGFSDCNHENNETEYFKCKKCGEFYK